MDWLWRGIIADIRLERGDGFVKHEDFLLVESELVRLFRLMNVVFKFNRNGLLLIRFAESEARHARTISRFVSKQHAWEKFAERRLARVLSMPPEGPWTYVEGRFSQRPKLPAAIIQQTLRIPEKEVLKESVAVPLFDDGLAKLFTPRTTGPGKDPRWHWSLVSMACAILSTVPSHEEGSCCRWGECLFSSERSAAVKMCVEVLQRIRKKVFEKFGGEHGNHCLESLTCFGKFDALASAVLQIAGLKSFLCRPSSRENMKGSRRFESFEEREHIVAGDLNIISTGDMMLVRENVRTGKKGRTGKQFSSVVVGIDFIHLEMNQLSKPALLSVCVDFNSSSESATHIDGFYLNVGDVVWLCCAANESVRGSQPQCESSFTFLGFVMDTTVTVSSSNSNILHRATLAIHLLDTDDLNKSGKSPAGVVKSIFAGLSGVPSAHGRTAKSSVATVLKTGRCILTEMNYFRFCFSRDTNVPMSFNLACVHSRLLQQHFRRFTEIIDRNSLKDKRLKSFGVAVSGEDIRVRKLNALTEFLSNKMPMLNSDQLKTLSKILQWSREMEDTFGIDAENYRGNGHILDTLQKFGHCGSEMRFIGALPFFYQRTSRHWKINFNCKFDFPGHQRA